MLSVTWHYEAVITLLEGYIAGITTERGLNNSADAHGVVRCPHPTNSKSRGRTVTKYPSRWLQDWACAMWANTLCMRLLNRVYASHQMSITRMKAEPALITDQYSASFDPLATPMDTFMVVLWRKLKSGDRHVCPLMISNDPCWYSWINFLPGSVL